MTSYEFEKAAKNAVIEAMPEINVNINDLELVWFTHVLGNKKCMIWGKPMGTHYAEVTYNVVKDEMYVDIYAKIAHKVLQKSELNFEA